jgi:hypothetical protein
MMKAPPLLSACQPSYPDDRFNIHDPDGPASERT